MQQDVLVVGAGPVGLTMAAELARYGVPVRIVDKAARRSDKSKALVLWSRSLELLDRSGCADAFLAAGHKVTGTNIVAGGRRIAHVGFETVASPHPYALMLPQSETERLLEAHLASLGISIEREVELQGLTASDDGVEALLAHADGRRETIEPNWLIGCDGAHSTVRHTLGLNFVGDTLSSDWILADVHLAGMPTPDSELDIYWHAAGVLALFPILPGRYRIIADVGSHHGASRPADPTLEEVQAILDQRGPGGIRASDPVWLAGFHINERKIADYRVKQVFLAGDAAHIHSPAGGQGMNTGMQDAFNLAWKLALVCRGFAAEEPLLTSYSQERSAIGAEVLAAAGRLTALAIVENPMLQSLRNHVARFVLGLSAVRRKMADTLTEVSIGYGPGLMVASGPHGPGGPHSGERAPLRPGEPAVGAGSVPRFALFGPAAPETEMIFARYKDLLEPVLRPGFADDGLWLVRPDGYVGVAAPKDHWDAIEAYLAGMGRAAA